jgi:hypothetical protein
MRIHETDCFGRGFKGLKQAIKLEFKLARYEKVRIWKRSLQHGCCANMETRLSIISKSFSPM